MSESPRESLYRVRWTLLALGAGVLPHVRYLPAWVSAAVVATGLWRLLIAHRQRPLPGRALRLLGAVLALIAVLATYRTVNGIEAGSALLALMAALKLLETRTLRDYVLLILIGCFLLLAAILRDQSLVLLPYYALATWLAVASLAAVTRSSAVMPWRRAVALSGRMLAYAAPLAAALFLLFPRVPGPFWALPSSSRATSGLGDEMTPGEISDLTLSDEPAFRVRFRGSVPAPIERYWRGPVMHDFDGYTWRRARGAFLPGQPPQFSGPRYEYRIMLEPNNRNWLFALDQPVAWRGDELVFQSFDYQLQLARPVTQPLSYELASYTRHASGGPLPLSVRRHDTQLPQGRNPRTLAFAAELRASNPDDRAYVRAVLDVFARQGFTYTLTPPRLDFDSVDDFLFNTRRGFCGHYASAFTMMMRAAGIPARVVTGYQGGIFNRVGGYWYVSQADAHAWSEIWLDGSGWQRVDPTAVVAPERLEGELDPAFGDEAAGTERWLGMAEWVRNLRFAWDAANTWWRDRVLEFDRFKQRELLERLGIPDPDWGKLGLLLAGALAVFFAWITLTLQRELRPRTRDPLLAVYGRFCRAAARQGVARRPDEGPVDFAARLKHALPGAQPSIDAFIDRFVRARYLATGEPVDLRTLGRLARELGRARRRASA
jgi:transglutaminase-like putative cysteine protease